MANDEQLYGHATELALTNFTVSGRPTPIAIVHALARIKAAMAEANRQFSETTGVDDELAAAIVAAAGEVLDGRWDEQFGVDAFQTGSGTSTNMNVNEVVAALATRRLADRKVHPNDHVNASQSTNDTFPTAIRIAALVGVRDVLVPGLTRLAESLGGRADAFATVVKAGRTHLMDASPIMLGHEFGGYHAQVTEAIERIADTTRRVAAVPLGGTATGNGLNAPAGASAVAIAELNRQTGLSLRQPPTVSPRRAGRTRSSNCPVSCGRRPSGSSRSPTTSGCWPAGRAPVWPRSCSPSCNPARRSCRAR